MFEDPSDRRTALALGAAALGATVILAGGLFLVQRGLAKGPPVRVELLMDPGAKKTLNAYLPVVRKIAQDGIDHHHFVGKGAKRPAAQ